MPLAVASVRHVTVTLAGMEAAVTTGADGRWQVELPARGVSVEIDAVNPQAWMATAFPYWEGPVHITGSHSGRGI